MERLRRGESSYEGGVGDTGRYSDFENRTPELKLINPDLNENIYKLIEAAELDPEQELRLDQELNRQYHILTRDDRLETVAQDIVRHFLGRGFVGKAIVIAIDKATALKMYNKVKKHWLKESERLAIDLEKRGNYSKGDSGSKEFLEDEARLKILKETDMALIVSPGQNEIAQMQKSGLDIVPHRQRMNEEALDEKFKDTEDPLRLVFVCAMWLTGFDAPSCSSNCSTKRAPWFVIPSDVKWFRNLAISEIINHTLKQMDLNMPKPLKNPSQYKII